MRTSAASNATPLWQSARVPSASFAPGTLIDGRYEILRPIDRGGRCEIVEARHLHTSRALVLKLLPRAEMFQSDAVRRIEREAVILGAIQHRGVVAISDAGMCKVTGRYLALEKLEGRTLEGLLIARRALGVDASLTIFRQLAAALAEVHRQGFVHRNVRAGNVFVGSSRLSGEASYLLNFADAAEIARTDEPWAALDVDVAPTALTAPEQLVSPTLADPRTDLYALGALIVATLGGSTDQIAFGGTDTRRATSLLAARSDVPRPLLDVLDALLASAPAERPQSAEAVLRALAGMGGRPLDLLRYFPAEAAGQEAPHLQQIGREAATDASRRRSPRAPYATPVRIVSEAGQIDGRSEDISASGLLVVTRDLVELQGVATVRFALPTTGRVVALQARPKWTRTRTGRTAIGLELVDVDEATAAAIDAYVRHMAVER